MIASVKKEFPALIVEGRRLGTCCWSRPTLVCLVMACRQVKVVCTSVYRHGLLGWRTDLVGGTQSYSERLDLMYVFDDEVRSGDSRCTPQRLTFCSCSR